VCVSDSESETLTLTLTLTLLLNFNLILLALFRLTLTLMCNYGSSCRWDLVLYFYSPMRVHSVWISKRFHAKHGQLFLQSLQERFAHKGIEAAFPPNYIDYA
jgi:hypothetical protein